MSMVLVAAPAEDLVVNHGAPHQPVLARETLEGLAPTPGATIVDGTLGAGGHAALALEATAPTGRVFGIDRDPEALRIAGERLAGYEGRFVPLRGRHEDLATLVRNAGCDSVDGVLLDLGVSSMQLDTPERGFSFREDGPLDMRMDPEHGRSVEQMLAELDFAELRNIIWTFGEEKRASAIAREIVRQRETSPLRRTSELAELVTRVLGPQAQRYRIHPATRTFQALRIAANGEIDGLARTVEDAVDLLAPGGRIAVIAYHSLEDRAIKLTLRGLVNRCTCPPRLPMCACGLPALIKIHTSRPIRPGDEEISTNPRSRSARLRVAEKL